MSFRRAFWVFPRSRLQPQIQVASPSDSDPSPLGVCQRAKRPAQVASFTVPILQTPQNASPGSPQDAPKMPRCEERWCRNQGAAVQMRRVGNPASSSSRESFSRFCVWLGFPGGLEPRTRREHGEPDIRNARASHPSRLFKDPHQYPNSEPHRGPAPQL